MKSEEKKKTDTPEASTTPSIEEQPPKFQALEGLNPLNVRKMT